MSNITHQRRASLRGEVLAYKVRRGCSYCGTKKNLTFHHRDPTTRLASIGTLMSAGKSSAVWEEIAKCDVMCETCHHKHHKLIPISVKPEEIVVETKEKTDGQNV